MLRTVWERWKKIAQVIGDFIGRIVLTIFYFTIFAPFGLAMRFLGDPLAIRLKRSPRWVERVVSDQSMDKARQLF